MFCRNCGSKIEDGAQFCAVCGASVSPDDQAQTGGANPSPVDAAVPTGPQQVDMAAEAVAPIPKRSKKPFIIAAVVVALLAVGGGAGWYFKIYRPRQERAAADLEDYGPEPDYENTYDGVEDDDTPPWDDEDDLDEKEDNH